MAFVLGFIKEFFSAVAGTRKGILVAEELFRSILTALGAASFSGLLLTLLEGVLAHASLIFPNPITASLATMILTLIIDLVRRLNQNGAPPRVPVPTAAIEPNSTD